MSSRTHSSPVNSSNRASAASAALIRAFASSFSSRWSASIPNILMTTGSVSPWKTSVPRITQNVRKMIRSRSGNGAPECVVKGIASAAASDTAPRMPDHATTIGWPIVARPRSARRESSLGKYRKTGAHTSLVPTTAAVVSAP